MRALTGCYWRMVVAALALGWASLQGAICQPAPKDPIWPVVELREISFAEAVTLLGKQAGIQLRWSESRDTSPPAEAAEQLIAPFRQERITPRAALDRLAAENGWRLAWEPSGSSAWLERAASPGSARPPLDAGWNQLPAGIGGTNLLGELGFDLSSPGEALTAGIRASGLNILLGPQVRGILAAPSSAGSLRLTNVTGTEALGALVQRLGLAVVWDSVTTIGRVTTRKRAEWESGHPLPPLEQFRERPAANTVQPLIFIDEAPLGEALATLAGPLGINLLYHHQVLSRMQSGGLPGALPATVAAKLRRVTLFQALTAVLANAGLALVPDPPSGAFIVMSWEDAWDEGQQPRLPSVLPAGLGGDPRYSRLYVHQVPLATVGVALARLAGVDLLWAPGIERTGTAPSAAPGERLVSFEVREVTAAQALAALLHSHNLRLDWDASNRLARVLRPAAVGLGSLSEATRQTLLKDSGDATRKTRTYAEEPLGSVLEGLAGEAGLQLAWDGGLNSTSAWPMIEARLTDRSARETMALLLGNYGLAVLTGEQGGIRVSPR